MATLFISDLHLDPARPDITELFLSFLKTIPGECEALYILGDLFEAWIGDDDPEPHHSRVIRALAAAARTGLPMYFMRGNRDFLVGKTFSQTSGLTLLGDTYRFEIGGIPTLLMHGDLLCTDDREYQAFRMMVQDPEWRRQFLDKSVEERRQLASVARAESRRRGSSKSPAIMDVNMESVQQTLQKHGVTRIIHGHTHRPGIHRFQGNNGSTCERIVLGDWYEQGSVLEINEAGIFLEQLPI